jgi:hypothetical protein
MMTEAGGAIAQFSWRRGRSALLIALIYALAGPPIGAILVLPIAVIATAQFKEGPLAESIAAVLFVLPIGFIFSYAMAGALAAVTGVAMAVIAYRRGMVPIGTALAVPTFVFGVFLILQQLFHGSIPGATLLRGAGHVGPTLGLLISIAASLVCWRLARPLQRRLA